MGAGDYGHEIRFDSARAMKQTTCSELSQAARPTRKHHLEPWACRYIHVAATLWCMNACCEARLPASSTFRLRECHEVCILKRTYKYMSYVFQACELQSGSSCFNWLPLVIRQQSTGSGQSHLFATISHAVRQQLHMR